MSPMTLRDDSEADEASGTPQQRTDIKTHENDPIKIEKIKLQNGAGAKKNQVSALPSKKRLSIIRSQSLLDNTTGANFNREISGAGILLAAQNMTEAAASINYSKGHLR